MNNYTKKCIGDYMKEYKIEYVKVNFSFSIDCNKSEQTLQGIFNRYAEKGWRLVSSNPINNPHGSGTDGILLFLEREKVN